MFGKTVTWLSWTMETATASFSMRWDQVGSEGGRATLGRYMARVQLANLVTRPFPDWGPQADVILE